MEVRSPHFIVVSNANEHEARRVAEQFEMIRAVFQEHSGNVSVNDQTIIILAAKDEDTLRPLLPEAWTKKGSAHRVGLYLNGPDKSYVGLRANSVSGEPKDQNTFSGSRGNPPSEAVSDSTTHARIGGIPTFRRTLP